MAASAADHAAMAAALEEHPEAYGRVEYKGFAALGMRLRYRPVIRHVRRHAPSSILDLGCGYRADLLTAVARGIPNVVGVDLEVDPVHAKAHGITGIDGEIVTTLAALDAGSFDCITMVSVLEHLPNPQAALDGIHRVLAPGGTAVVHVPTWLGKPVLEAVARRGIGTDSIDDHRTYYRVAELWPMIVRAGFRPLHIRMRYTLLGFALRAEVRKPAA